METSNDNIEPEENGQEIKQEEEVKDEASSTDAVDDDVTTDDEKKEEADKLVSFALPPFVTRIIKCQEAIETDYQYFEALVAVATVRALAFRLGQNVTGSLVSVKMSSFGDMDSKIIVRGHKLMNLLQGVLAKLEAKLAKELESMKRRPIIEQLLDALEATELERKIFRHCVIKASGAGNTSTSSDVDKLLVMKARKVQGFGMTRIREMFASEEGSTLRELMPMVDSENSKWVKEQLYYKATPTQNFIAFDQGTVQILMGLDITPTQVRCPKTFVFTLEC
jgi:hypothetical protein